MAEQFTTLEKTPPTEQGTKFPPFDRSTFGSQLIWLAIFFGLLYILASRFTLHASRFALPRVGSVLATRHVRIAADFDVARRMKDEAADAGAAYEKAMADARSRAQMIAAETRARLAAQAEEGRKELEAGLAAKLVEADKAIASAKKAALTNVRSLAEEAAAAIVTRLTGATPPQVVMAAAIDSTIKD